MSTADHVNIKGVLGARKAKVAEVERLNYGLRKYIFEDISRYARGNRASRSDMVMRLRQRGMPENEVNAFVGAVLSASGQHLVEDDYRKSRPV